MLLLLRKVLLALGLILLLRVGLLLALLRILLLRVSCRLGVGVRVALRWCVVASLRLLVALLAVRCWGIVVRSLPVIECARRERRHSRQERPERSRGLLSSSIENSHFASFEYSPV